MPAIAIYMTAKTLIMCLLVDIVRCSPTCTEWKSAFQTQCCGLPDAALSTTTVPTNDISWYPNPPMYAAEPTSKLAKRRTNTESNTWLDSFSDNSTVFDIVKEGWTYWLDFNMHGALTKYFEADALVPAHPVIRMLMGLSVVTNYNSATADSPSGGDTMTGDGFPYANRTSACHSYMTEAVAYKSNYAISSEVSDFIDAMAMRCDTETIENFDAYVPAMDALAMKYAENIDIAEQRMFAYAYIRGKRRVGEHVKDENRACIQDMTLYNGATPFTTCALTTHGAKLMQMIESILAADPTNINANHVKIHVLELGDGGAFEYLVPSASALEVSVLDNPRFAHSIHMTSHIFMRAGLFERAHANNKLSIERGEAYVAMTNPYAPFVWNQFYLGHNYFFTLQSALALGLRAEFATTVASYDALAQIQYKVFAASGFFDNANGIALLGKSELTDPATVTRYAYSGDGDEFTEWAYQFARSKAAMNANNATASLEAINSMYDGAGVDLYRPSTTDLDPAVYDAIRRNKLFTTRRMFALIAKELHDAKFANSLANVQLDVLAELEHEVEATGTTQENFMVFLTPSLYLGYIHLTCGRPSDAKDAFESGLALRPGVKHMQKGLNEAHAALGTPLSTFAPFSIPTDFSKINSVQMIESLPCA